MSRSSVSISRTLPGQRFGGAGLSPRRCWLSSSADLPRTAMEHEMRSARTTVLVTAIGGGGVGEQVLKALRMAGGYRIVGCDIRPRCPQFALVNQAVPLPPANAPDYLDALLAVSLKLGVRAIFPGSELELRVISRARDAFEAAGLFLALNTPEVIEIGMN